MTSLKRRTHKVGDLGLDTETETVMTPRKQRMMGKKLNPSLGSARGQKKPWQQGKGPERRDSVDVKKASYWAQQLRGGGGQSDTSQMQPSERNYTGENEWITQLLREREKDREVIGMLVGKLEEQQGKLERMAEGIESMDEDASDMLGAGTEEIESMSSLNY